MKTIGLIGGMSWESSAVYYRLLNEGVRDRLSPTASARIVLWSFDFSEVERLQQDGRWVELAHRMADAARRLERAGAELLLIGTNTMHHVAGAVAAAVSIPLLHIADSTAEKIKASGLRRVALLGTAFTMEQAFYREHLRSRHGLEVMVPGQPDRELVQKVIYHELVAGIRSNKSRLALRRVIGRLVASGAQGIILGCTELALLIGSDDSPVPLFDTTALHAGAAVHIALQS